MRYKEQLESEYVVKLVELIKSDGTIDCPLDKDFLSKFIRARKNNADSAFVTLKRYYEMRSLYYEDLQAFYPSALSRTLNSGIFMVLKDRDSCGRKILLFRTELWDTSIHSVNDVFLTALLLGEEMILSKKTQENGTIMIHDLSHLGLCHAKQFSLRQVKKFIAVLQGSFPAKFKAIHVLNQPYIHNVLFALAQPFLSKKFLSRVTLHGRKITELHQFISPEILPQSVGGILSNNDAEDKNLMLRLMEKDEYYKNMLTYGIQRK